MSTDSILQNKRRDARVKAMTPPAHFSGFDLMRDISKIAEDAIKKSYRMLEQEIFGRNQSPTAIFLYGSGGRGEMTNYSDIDIHFISATEDSRTLDFQRRLHQELAGYQFGKIDDPNWKNMESLENYAKRSITEANQIFDARLIAGDVELAKKLENIINKYDTPERKVRNMLFQKFYLEHYYKARSNPEVPNVKYCSGGYRDLLTFDWFNNWISSTKGLPLEVVKSMPQMQHSIQDMKSRGVITPKEESQTMESTEFMVLLRNEILHANIGTPDEGITHLDVPTMERTWNSSKDYFLSKDIRTPEELLPSFKKHARTIQRTKNKILDHVVSSEEEEKGDEWGNNYHDSISIETTDERRREISTTEDAVLKLTSIWGMNEHSKDKLFNEICEGMVNTAQWEILASMACSSKSSPELLDEISKTSMKHEGLGYILRILGRNPSISKRTLEDIAGNSSLDRRYKIVASLNLEKGLYIATTRAS